jgi:drug/metabolite transporter (DMT)-like permease
LSSTVYGLLNAVVIVAYTVVDGLGVRLSGNPSSYILWLFLLIPLPLLFWTLLHRPGAFQAQFRLRWRGSILGGMCTAGSYGLALWAMTLAPIALVAGLRETSVIFGTVFAWLFLKEQFGVLRYAAAGAVTAGGMAIKLF